jgi:hypothetical protein
MLKIVLFIHYFHLQCRFFSLNNQWNQISFFIVLLFLNNVCSIRIMMIQFEDRKIWVFCKYFPGKVMRENGTAGIERGLEL